MINRASRWVTFGLAATSMARAAQGQVAELPSPYPYPDPAWSPYLVGGLIGLLAVTTLSFAKKKVGASSAYASLAGVIGRVVAPNHLRTLRYFRDNPPHIGWSLIFVIGAGIGAWIAAWSGGELTGTYLQPMWLRRFGADSYGLRTLVAFMGGVAMAYGARMAGGCTSGHGISGTLQLALSSWIAVLCFFVGGIVTAGLLYRL